MRRKLRWVVAAAVVVLIAVLHWVGVIVAGVGLVFLVRYLLGRFPLRDCRACNGAKGHRDWIWFGAFGKCHTCKGSGVRPRPAVALFMPDTAEQIRNGNHGQNF
jgi:hypothetical protein